MPAVGIPVATPRWSPPSRQPPRPTLTALCPSNSKLRPPPDPERKSQLLSTCLRSVLALPPLDVLEKDIHLSLEMLDVQVQTWRPRPSTKRGPSGRPGLGSLQEVARPAPRGQCAQAPPQPQPSVPPGLLILAQTLYKQTLKALDQMLQSFITQNPVADELYFLLSHLYVWLASEKTHERQRAAYIFVALLKFLSRNPDLWRSRPPGSLPPGPSGSLSALPPGQPKEDFKRMGQLVGMLGILCQDPDRATQSSSLEGLGHLYWLLMRQRAEETSQVEMQAPEQPAQPSADGAPVCSSGDQKAAPPSPRRMVTPKDHISELDSSQVIKKIMKYLTVAELTDLIWTAIDGLGSTNPSCVQAAADMLLVAIQEHGAKLETVASLSRAIHLQLYSIRISQAKENALRAITLLAQNHTPELVAAFLDFSIPLDSLAFQLWRALGAELPVSRLVLALLMAWLRERPLPTGASDGSPQPQEKTYLRSLAAMNTLHKLQLAREFRRAVQEAYPALLLALLTQMHYVLELQLPAGPPPGQEAQEAQEVATPSPQSTSLEALKSLLSTTGHWQDFAHLELLGAWELFTTLHTYPQGVGLLARAMVQNCCKQIQAVIGQLLPSLQCREERERKVAILILTEFLYSPALLEVLPQQAALMVLARSLRDPSPEVRVLSLQGLGNILFHPEKGSLLRAQLPLFLDGFFQNSEPVVLRIMGTLSDALHCLGLQGAGAQSLSIAINARSFFDDERDGIRAAAMALFGDLVATMAGRKLNGLQAQVHQSMVPLLLHLRDHCPAVVTQAKFTFYRCAMLLPWRLRHTLFCTLAWERGLSARHFLWTCLMTRSQEEFGIHLAQALSYLHSRHRHIKIWAALFLGYTICYHPRAVSRMVNYVNANLLFCTFQDLKKDQEPGIREFATRQLFFLQAVVARRQ
ncbi:hypothetical protein HPG69_007578 [Diceros bicornis minor]|uniref:Maestro heat-like repeat family member 5 n=1 Tax=Diceros bicornis minor TaxID=77932 RepID=A0A7J7F6N5_DICBM|nr:hypothetical protein HPG69_007578 [Diceros bicornis minor]